ncbi:MAG: endolytic transglycosylase MltG [Flavobacteriales bacterium]|jgi:UPF0755 protein
MNSTFRRFLSVLALLALALAGGCYWYLFHASNTAFQDESRRFYITRDLDGEGVIRKLSNEGIIKHSRTLRWSISGNNQDMFKPGRYRIPNGMSNTALIRMLQNGEQEALAIPVTDLRNVSRIAGRLAQYLELDSSAFAGYLLDPSRIDSCGFTPASWPAFFLAGEYTLRWTDTPSQVFRQFERTYHHFWNAERTVLAAQMGMSPAEITTLASIVKGEAMKPEEAPRIAGLYLNRLRTGMPLQADPTVVFALGMDQLGQVLFSDLDVDSPYNTYNHPGLPPGPIFITDSVYISAVLHAESHAYIYMCAKPGGIGEHAFAATYKEHLENASAYRKWLRDYQAGSAADSSSQ